MLLHEAMRRQTGSWQLHEFYDVPEARFSIHSIVEQSFILQKKNPGEFYGPQQVMNALEALQSDSLTIVTCHDGNVFLDRIQKAKKPCFVGIPIRLGISDKIDPIYLPALAAVFDIPHCTGIAGG